MIIIPGTIGEDGFVRAQCGDVAIAVFMSPEQIERAYSKLRSGQTATLGNTDPRLKGVGISLNLENVEEIYRKLNR